MAGGSNAAKRVVNDKPGPWAQWRIRTRHGRAIKFIETYCRAPKGMGFGKPLKLARFQKEFLEEALASTTSTAVLQTPRGNGKSSGGGALALWALFDDMGTGAPQVPIVATTISQAIRSCYGVAVGMLKAEPELHTRALIYTGISQPKLTVPYNSGEMFPISSDPDGLQGLDPSLGIMDEIGFQPAESWNSLRLAQGKREWSVIVGVGTPGLDRENALFHLRKTVHEGGKVPGFVFHEYSAPEDCAIDDRGAWYIANPAIKAGFLRVKQLEDDLGITQEGHFRIFRLGQWYEGVDSWLGPNGKALWDGLTEPAQPVDGAETWVGINGGRIRESLAVVTVQRREDGHLHAWCRLWVPTDDVPVDTTDVMAHIRDLAARYSVEAVAYDPQTFTDVPAKMLSDEGLTMVDVPHSTERMTPIYGSLLELIKRGDLRHDDDEAFATHVLNAIPRFNERGFTLQKAKSRGHTEGVVALALAADRALHPTPTGEILIAWR